MTVYRAANLWWNSDGGDRRLVRTLAKDADVLALVECRTSDNKPLDIREILGVEWRVFQNTTDAARAGSAIAVHRDSGVRWRRPFPTRARVMSAPGRDVQTRYLRTARLIDDRGPVTIGVPHIPLEDTGRQDDAIRTLRAWWHRTPGRKVILGDGNMPHAELQKRIGAAYSDGADVMFVCWSTGWPAMTTKAARMSGTDHNVLRFAPTKEKP